MPAPSAAPNVCCPEPFGLSTAELFSVCAWLGESCTVIGGDLCEVVPSTPGLCSEQVGPGPLPPCPLPPPARPLLLKSRRKSRYQSAPVRDILSGVGVIPDYGDKRLVE